MKEKERTIAFLRNGSDGETSDRFNEGKPQFSLIDYDCIEPLTRTLMYGNEKYGFQNWKAPAKEGPIQYIDSALRHLTALAGGELLDKESGIHHTGHIMANMMMFQYHTKDFK